MKKASEAELLSRIVEKLQVSEPVARSLLLESRTLSIRLNYNGPSGAEKAYKRAIRKLKQHLHGGAYGRWLDIQRALHETRRDAEQETGYCTPQRTWREQKQS